MFSRFPRPLLGLLLVPLAVVALSIAVGVTGLAGLYGAQRSHSDLDRFVSGRPVAIEVEDPGERQVWVRHDDYSSEDDTTTVTVERNGEAVAVRALPGDVTYQETNTAITAVWAFDADRPGTYTVTGNDINQSATFLVGAGDPEVERQHASRQIIIGVAGVALGLIAGLAIAAIAFRRRRPPSLPAAPSAAHAGP